LTAVSDASASHQAPRRVIASHRRARRALRVLPITLVLLASLCHAAAEPLAVEVENASTPTLCAETDNVYLKLISAQVRRFTIEARHPAYLRSVAADDTAADFRHCHMASDPAHPAEPRRVVLYDTPDLELVGLTFPSFWRPNNVPVRIGEHSEQGLHLLQLFVRFGRRREEVLVLYPADGYWRARPLPPPYLRSSGYGSSFLIGPVEPAARPFVELTEVAFDPPTRTFTLAFARGGSASLRLDAVDRAHAELAINLDPAVEPARPFAALRSMFVSETNADVARVAWRAPGQDAFATTGVMNLTKVSATKIWTGRTRPSRHNTSAPDITFGRFLSNE
jgi:hypothetical protein